MSDIAACLGTSEEALMAANPNITDPDLIYTGDTLTIPNQNPAVTGEVVDTTGNNTIAAPGTGELTGTASTYGQYAEDTDFLLRLIRNSSGMPAVSTM